jgi:hypothetical protein
VAHLGVQEILVDRRQLFAQRLVQLRYDFRIATHSASFAAPRRRRVASSYPKESTTGKTDGERPPGENRSHDPIDHQDPAEPGEYVRLTLSLPTDPRP